MAARLALDDKTRRLDTVLLLLMVLLAMALRLYHLDASSLWFDEIKAVLTSRLDFLSMLDFQAKSSVHPPLLYMITHLFLTLFGDSDFVARLPATLFGSLSIVLAFKVGAVLWTRKEGLLGAFLLAVSPYHVRFSQEARHYGLMVFLTLLALVFLLNALRKNDKTLWIGFALCTALSMYTHYFTFFVLPGEVALAAWVIADSWMLQRRQRRCADPEGQASTDVKAQPADDETLSPGTHSRSSARFALSGPTKQALRFSMSLGLAAVLFVPWLPQLQQQMSSRFIEFQGVGAGTVPGIALSPDYLHGVLWSYTGMDGLPLLLFLALLGLGLATSRPPHMLLTALWISTPFLFILFVKATHFFAPRYAICVLPISLLLIARGITVAIQAFNQRLSNLKGLRTGLLLVGPAVTIALFAVPVIMALGQHYAREKTDWRSAAEYLKENMSPGDMILADGVAYNAAGDDYRTSYCLSFYLARYGMSETPLLPINRGLLEAMPPNMVKEGERLWAVVFLPDELAVNEADQQVTVAPFQDVSIVHVHTSSAVLAQLLEALVDLLPAPQAHFDIHLALAELYLRTGQSEQARSQLDMAAQVKPDHPRASSDLAATRAEFQELTASEEDAQHPLWRNFDDVLTFLGYRIHPNGVEAGTSLQVTLWWRAPHLMDRDYTLFIHMIGPDGRIWAQQDRLLQHGDYPTSMWLPGETVKSEYELQLPADAPPGEYTLKMGIYYWETGERLPVWDGEGQRAPDDAVLLQSITLTE